MSPSTTTPQNTENAAPAKRAAKRKAKATTKVVAPVKVTRAPKTREAGIAQGANTFALAKSGRSFGAPVTEPQVRYYEQALKALRKSKTNAQWLGFKSNEAALRALRPVAQGTASSATLPKATKDSFDKLYARLNILHSKDGRVNKTWPRKHAIVLCALMSEKPARKPVAKKVAKPVAEQVSA